MITANDIKQWLEVGLPGAQVMTDGDGYHFEARIVYADFAGKNTLERHRMVYEALGDKMKADIHALSIKTLTPQEVG